MRSIRILDCTLRDGGFINDWKFGIGSIKSIISRLSKSGIDIIEIGFIDQRRNYDADRTIVPNSGSIDPILKNIDTRKSMIVGMIDYGTCDIDKIKDQKNSCIDGIRVIFKKKDQDNALAFLSQLKEKGYKIFVQPVSITSYSKDDVLSIIEKINKIKPYAVSVVDTYGLMHKTELLVYFSLFDEHLDDSIVIGYHSHNNFQLAYSNSIELIKTHSNRDLVIDSSLYGMGKGAGNANTELIAMYLNENFSMKYDIDQLLEAIDVDIMKEFEKHSWGYSLLYYISALNDCHPDYVNVLLSKKTLAVRSVNEILGKIPAEKKLSFSKDLLESLYSDYQNKECGDVESYARLKAELFGRPILLLGPGTSIIKESDKIRDYIRDNDPVTFSINFINDQYDIDYVFMGNAKRYSQFFHKIYGDDQKCKVICTSNISQSTKKIDFVFNYLDLSLDIESVSDNPLLMLLQILKKCGIEKVVLAGFDGYKSDNADNYYNEYIPFLYCDKDVMKRNENIASYLEKINQNMEITSLTKTMYLRN